MKLTELVKKELSGWKLYELIGLVFVMLLIFVNTYYMKDSPIAVCSAVCGILYTIIAGKGKISCYLFGLSGSVCYVWLAFASNLWGNMLLYLCYYIPMQIFGIFQWKNHLKKESKEIIKTRLSNKERILMLLISIIGSLMFIIILNYLGDKSPIIDGITTFLSILGMYLTVKRSIEQWLIWLIVNGLSFVMWLDIVMQGTKAYATVIMWGVYFILAIYFYFLWKKELENTAFLEENK